MKECFWEDCMIPYVGTYCVVLRKLAMKLQVSHSVIQTTMFTSAYARGSQTLVFVASAGGLLKTWIAGSHARVSDSAGLGVG